MLYIKAIYDSDNNGWFIRINDGDREIDSLPPSVSRFDNNDLACDRDIKKLALEAVRFEGYDVKDISKITRVNGNYEVEIG